MKPIALAIAGGLLAGCTSTSRDQTSTSAELRHAEAGQQSLTAAERLRIITPVFNSFAEALTKIASKYPEIGEFREEKAKGSTEDAIWCRYSHNFTSPTVKRPVVPTDFGKHGFALVLACRAFPPPDRIYAMSTPSLKLNSLRFYVWAEVRAACNPPPGLVDEIKKILRAHLNKLEEIDRKSSNQKNARLTVRGNGE